MADRVKGIVVELGGDTTGLSKALSGVNKEINNTQKELKDVERLLKLDPGNTELLRQKQELLAKTVGQTKEKLDALKEAEKQVQEQFKRGEVSEDQYNSLKREIIATEAKLNSLESEAKKTENAINGIDESPIEEVEEAAKKAEKELNDAGKEASNFKDYLKADALVEGAKGLLSTMSDIAYETKEYQKIVASLETSSERAGYSAEETTRTYKQLYGVLGDDQTAATTVANLQAMHLSQDQLTRMTNAAIGAWATYGDSIPIDGLAEAINETTKTGKVTGTLADALNWAGVSEDDFNARLEKTTSESERANLILQQLSNQGLEETGKAWQENNKNLVENNQASADMQEQMAEFGEVVMPIITDIVEATAGLLGKFNSLDEKTQKIIIVMIALVATMGPLMSVFGGISGLITTVSGAFSLYTGAATTGTATSKALAGAMSFIAANPIVLLVTGIAALVGTVALGGDQIQEVLQWVDDFLQKVFAVDWTTIFAVLGEALNGFFANLKNIWDATKRIFDGIIDFIRGVFTGDWDRAWKGVQNIFGGIFDGLIAAAKAPLNGVIALINGMIGGINWVIEKINGISFTNPFNGETIGFDFKTIGKLPYLANGGVLSRGSAIVGEAGPELLTMDGGKAVVEPLTNHTTTNHTYGGVVVNVYGAPGQDVEEFAEIVSEKISDTVARKGAAFA